MRVDSPVTLLVSLVAATLLGLIIGYCLGLLRSKRRARQAIEEVSRELTQRRSAAEVDLASAREVAADLKEVLAKERERVKKALNRESALELHSQLQAQRIQTLESQVRSFEDQQIRLKRDFAKYKSNKSRELELARNKPDAWSGTHELPVLQKRIVNPSTQRGRRGALHSVKPSDRDQDTSEHEARRSSRGLSTPLSRELEIPTLAESELPDSVEDLDFELVDLDGSGELPRG